MSIARFVDQTVKRLRNTKVDLGLLAPNAVVGSMFSGATGIAFFLYEAARLRNDDALYERAHDWSNAAAHWAKHATKEQWQGSPHGLVNGATGLAYVQALLSAHENDSTGVLRSLSTIERAATSIDGNAEAMRSTELYGGSAGILCAALSLRARLGDSLGKSEQATLSRIRRTTTTAVKAAHRRTIPERLALAHGCAGELLSLVAAVGPTDFVSRRLDELAVLHQTDVKGRVFWLSHQSSSDTSMLGSFCSGMAGHVVLWTEVARQTRSKQHARLARQSAESLSVLRTGSPSLCCGLAAQSAAFQQVADLFGDERWARLAYSRISHATSLMSERVTVLGLWQGTLGVALVAMKRLAGESGFPCIDLTPPTETRQRRTM
jgi:Lanthionine synthetase C-like protein